MILKRTILLLSLLTLTLSAGAQRRSESAAEALAKGFLHSTCGSAPRLQRAKHHNMHEATSPLAQELQPYYIFNDESKGAFVIVSGDRRMRDILGWSTEGTFDEGEMPEGLADLLELYARQWADVELLALTPKRDSLAWDTLEIAPLLTTQWGQGAPFNARCPYKGRGARSVVGCVATAMAQILKYYHYPVHGRGEHSYVSGTEEYFCSFNFGSATFDWTNMLDIYYEGDYTSSEADAVSLISYACGVSVDMDYSSSGSGAFSDDVPYALGQYFKCNPYISRYMRDYYRPEVFDSLLCAELRAQRPILFCGARNDSVGHAYIIDGVDANHLYHFNWGWSGSRDGYYALDGQYPYESMHYDFYHEAICRISPDTIGSLEQIFYTDTFKVDREAIARFDTLHADISTIVCANSNLTHIDNSLYWNGLFGVGLYDEKGHFVCWADTPDALQTNYSELYHCWYKIGLPITICRPGTTWSLKPCVLPDGQEEPVPMHTLHAQFDSIPVYVTIDSIFTGNHARMATSVKPQPALIVPEGGEPGGTYDLQGRPLGEGARGIVVSKGKKVLRR